MKLTKLAFLRKLSFAAREAGFTRGGAMCQGYQIRDAIDRAGLPLPPFKNLEKADDELHNNPIFIAVERTSRDLRPLERFEEMMFAEAAWEHYQSLPASVADLPHIVHVPRAMKRVAVS